jgi:DNA mismatch repair protein MSH5
MDSFLADIVERTVQAAPGWAAAYIKSCIFLPQLVFLIATELDTDTGKGRYVGNRHKSDHWDQVFVADGLVHYKNDDMRSLDEQFGDVYYEITGMIINSNGLSPLKRQRQGN